MATIITRDWYLDLNGVPLATPAWEILDLSPLLDDPEVRGSDVLIPGVEGVVPNRRRLTVTVRTLFLEVYGETDHEGAVWDDPLSGVVANLDYLKTNLGLAAGGDGTVDAVFHRGDVLDPIGGPVTFLGFKGSAMFGDSTLRTSFDLSVPAGMFVPIES